MIYSYRRIYIGDLELNGDEALVLALNDGFDTVADFFNWFFGVGKHGHYQGQIVHWTNFRYELKPEIQK